MKGMTREIRREEAREGEQVKKKERRKRIGITKTN